MEIYRYKVHKMPGVVLTYIERNFETGDWPGRQEDRSDKTLEFAFPTLGSGGGKRDKVHVPFSTEKIVSNEKPRKYNRWLRHESSTDRPQPGSQRSLYALRGFFAWEKIAMSCEVGSRRNYMRFALMIYSGK